jgi:hypothetical protein
MESRAASSTRKRKIVLLILTLLFVGLVIGLFVGPEEKLGLDLTFLAYTNEALPVQTAAGTTMTFYRSIALLQASNSGSRSVEVFNGISRANVHSSNFGSPLTYGFPMTLKPGETALVRVQPARPPWRSELGYRRHEARERVLGRIWNAAGNQGRQWLSSMDLWPDFKWVKCGPITNEIPQLPRLVSLTNYFLDLPDPDLHGSSKGPFNIHQLLTNFPLTPSLRYETSEK